MFNAELKERIMVGNALLVTIAVVQGYLFWLMGELIFLPPIKAPSFMLTPTLFWEGILAVPSVLSEEEGNLTMRARYQKGSLKQIKRKSGYLVWLFRWRETDPDGKRRPMKVVVGPVSELRTESDARRALQALRIDLNLDLSEQARRPRKFADLVDHYRLKELGPQNNDRKSYSTKMTYKSYLPNWIIPRWGGYMLARMESGIAVHVEVWLGTISRSRGTKAKIRNIMSAVCSHAVRYGWMMTNPIRAVRQSAKRERVVMPLTAEELQKLFAQLGSRERTLVLLDVPTGMRRGEVLAKGCCKTPILPNSVG